MVKAEKNGSLQLIPAQLGTASIPVQKRALLALSKAPEEFLRAITKLEGAFLSDTLPLCEGDSCPESLSRHAVGEKTVNAVLSQLSGVTSIEGSFLTKSWLRVVDLRSMNRLTAIGAEFLCECFIEELLFPPSLRRIGDRFLAHSSVKKVDLSHTPLWTVGDSFLENAKSEELLLPPSLSSVGNHFLANSTIKKVDLSHTSLVTLGDCFLRHTESDEILFLPSLGKSGWYPPPWKDEVMRFIKRYGREPLFEVYWTRRARDRIHEMLFGRGLIDDAVLSKLKEPAKHESLDVPVRQSIIAALKDLYLSDEPPRRSEPKPQETDPAKVWQSLYQREDVQESHPLALRVDVSDAISSLLQDVQWRRMVYNATWEYPIRVEVVRAQVARAKTLIESAIFEGSIQPKELIEIVACAEKSPRGDRTPTEAETCRVASAIGDAPKGSVGSFNVCAAAEAITNEAIAKANAALALVKAATERVKAAAGTPEAAKEMSKAAREVAKAGLDITRVPTGTPKAARVVANAALEIATTGLELAKAERELARTEREKRIKAERESTSAATGNPAVAS